VPHPRGTLSPRVQAVGPEHFGILSIDGAKHRSVLMLCDFYGKILLPPTEFTHTAGGLQEAVTAFRHALRDHALRDAVVALERTGAYHRPVARAFRQAGAEVRLVDPLCTHHFRQPADPDAKTDETDLAAIHRAAANGFGLNEPVLPEAYHDLRLLARHRRDLVRKLAKVHCQIREHLHALLPGYADCFNDLWTNKVALVLARRVASAAALRQAGLDGLARLLADAGLRAVRPTLAKILAWAETAPAPPPQADLRHRLVADYDDDRLAKNQQIQAAEVGLARCLAQTPYVRLLALPGINVASAAELAGEAGPMPLYPNANALTGRAGLMPRRYQSDRVDHADGPLARRANRRLRFALLQIADNLIACNHYFQAKATLWAATGHDPRWVRVKVAKILSRLAYRLVAGSQLLNHPALQRQHYILDKLVAFHRDHATAAAPLLADLQAALEHVPPSCYAAEREPLAERLAKIQAGRRGPQVLGDILPVVLARLGVAGVESSAPGERTSARDDRPGDR
jgi:transposase